MSNKDVGTLRYSANFSTYIGKDVLWIPANELGGSQYNNVDMEAVSLLSPEEKRACVSTLYEAMQLFIISGFTEELDVICMEDEGISWEHHKPGYYAVKTNRGCCASTSSWLTYMLKGKYEEIGLLCFSRIDGSGHVLNYILHNGWYYVIDLVPFTSKYIVSNCEETGNKTDFVKSKYITGVCAKTKDLRNYAKLFNRMLKYGGFSFVFYQQKSDIAVPIHVEDGNGFKLICYPQDMELIRLTEDNDDIHSAFIQGPQNTPDWAQICNVAG